MIASIQTLGDALTSEMVASRMLQEHDERTWQRDSGKITRPSANGYALNVGNFRRRVNTGSTFGRAGLATDGALPATTRDISQEIVHIIEGL